MAWLHLASDRDRDSDSDSDTDTDTDSDTDGDVAEANRIKRGDERVASSFQLAAGSFASSSDGRQLEKEPTPVAIAQSR